jgi:hypothetical protein
MTAAAAERILAREGLAPLDHDDGSGGIKVGNKGSGKLLNATEAFSRRVAAAELETRQAILAAHRYSRRDRRIVEMWAAGKPYSVIAIRIGKTKTSVHRTVARIKKRHRTSQERGLAQLLHGCDSETIVLFFALLERALEAPHEAQAMISKARAIPEIRALLEPDEVSHD